MAILTDNFNDNSRDTVKWSLGSIAFSNAAVGVAETNQQLEITPIANEAAAEIYGYQSATTHNFTGAELKIRLAADFGAPSEAWLVVALDADNYFRIHAVGGGNLFTRSRAAAGNSNQDHGAFSFATHTYWKIRHDNGTDEIVWEYSDDGSVWTELRRLSRPFAITSATIYLSGGSAASSPTPPTITFDDFTLQVPGGVGLFRGRNVPFFDDDEVNRFEFWPTQAAGEETIVTPSTASLTLSGQSPSLLSGVTPDAKSLTKSSFAPSLSLSTTPSQMVLTLATLAPTVIIGTAVIPATASLTTSAFAPSLHDRISVSTASLTTTPLAVTITIMVTPGIASLNSVTFSPSVLRGTNVSPGSISLSIGTFPAQLVLAVQPPAFATLISAFAPALNVSVTAGTRALSIGTFAPQITEASRFIPTTANVSLVNLAAHLALSITPSAQTLTVSGFDPTVIVQSGLVPIPATLSLNRFAPLLKETLTPSTASLTTLGLSPSPRIGTISIPATQAANISGFAPALAYSIALQSTALTLTSFASEIFASEPGTRTPITTILTLSTFIPTLGHYYPRQQINIAAESRTIVVSSEDRTIIIPAERQPS